MPFLKRLQQGPGIRSEPTMGYSSTVHVSSKSNRTPFEVRDGCVDDTGKWAVGICVTALPLFRIFEYFDLTHATMIQWSLIIADALFFLGGPGYQWVLRLCVMCFVDINFEVSMCKPAIRIHCCDCRSVWNSYNCINGSTRVRTGHGL